MYELDNDTYIADTPGFSTFDVYEIPYRELEKYFIEFRNSVDRCRYIGCSHIKEEECGIKSELNKGTKFIISLPTITQKWYGRKIKTIFMWRRWESRYVA